MASALGLHEVNPDWASYSDCTDVGVVREAFLSRFGRYPTGRELAGYVEAFVRLLEEAHRSDPTAFSAVKGASQLLEALAATGEWSVSIATGCWERSARLKLMLAHLSVDGLPFSVLRVMTRRRERSWFEPRFSEPRRMSRIPSSGSFLWAMLRVGRPHGSRPPAFLCWSRDRPKGTYSRPRGCNKGSCRLLGRSRNHRRISKRRVQFGWRDWQRKAGFSAARVELASKETGRTSTRTSRPGTTVNPIDRRPNAPSKRP